MTDQSKPERQDGDGLRTALENARRDMLALMPRSDTGSLRARQITASVTRIEAALATSQSRDAAEGTVSPCPVCGINNNSPFPCEHTSPSPSPAGAAKPVAWRWQHVNDRREPRPWHYEDAPWHGNEYMQAESLYATPPVRRDREAVIEECAKICERAAQRCVREQIAGDSVATFCAQQIRALSRQAPPSSSEGGRIKDIFYSILTKHYPQDATLDAAWQDVKEAGIFSK